MTAGSVKNIVSALCGIVLLYMVLGSLVSLAFPSATAFRSSCTPGGLLHTLTQCDGATLNTVWRWTMGIPRFLLLWPFLAILLFQTFDANFGSHATFAVVVQTISVLGLAALATMTWIGFRFWQSRAPVIMWPLLIVFFGFSTVFLAGPFVLTSWESARSSLESRPENPSPPL